MAQPLDQNLGKPPQMFHNAHAGKLVQLLHLHLCADPILAYSAGAEVNQLQWSATQPDWVAICFGNKTQILRV